MRVRRNFQGHLRADFCPVLFARPIIGELPLHACPLVRLPSFQGSPHVRISNRPILQVVAGVGEERGHRLGHWLPEVSGFAEGGRGTDRCRGSGELPADLKS